MARLSNVKRIVTAALFVCAASAALFECAASAALFECAASAQLPRIGYINFYGLRTLKEDQILAAARVGTGDTVPASRIDLEDRIIALPEVMDAHVQSVCCEGDHTTLFIGIRERGESDLEFHATPSGTAALPEELMARYRKYTGELLRAEVKGKADAPDPVIRRDQEYFRTYAAGHTLKLRTELHSGADAEQRAAAAMVIGYSVNKRTAVDDLIFALLDPDEGVRANALRALADIAVVARKQPALGIRIPPATIVDLLNSVVLSDRVEANKALVVLTEKPNAAALDRMRERALPALAEMARWHTPSYAQPPFLLLGRLAGLKEVEINDHWEKDDREPVIQQALDTAPKKPGLQ